MAIFIKDDIILSNKIDSYITGLSSFSEKKTAVSSQFIKGNEDGRENKVAKIDRVTAQIRIFRTTKRDDRIREKSITRSAKVGNFWFKYHSEKTVNVYDLKILLSICALGEAKLENYLQLGFHASGWKGLVCNIPMAKILKFIGRRNDPENRERLSASLNRLCKIYIEIKNYDTRSIPEDLHQYRTINHETNSMIKIIKNEINEPLKIGLCWHIAKEAWIDNKDPKYAPVSMEEIQVLSKNDIAVLLLVFFRSNLSTGVGAIYRYDDMVRLVRGEDGNSARVNPTKGSTNSRFGHHSGADRQSIYTIKSALKLIDECTDMNIYKHKDFSKFVVVRPRVDISKK